MENIKLILENIFKKQKLNSVSTCSRIIEIWQDAVGPRIARHSRPKRLQNKTLWVDVDSSVWMQQLYFMEEKIKAKLNQIIGPSIINKIRFKLGELEFPSESSSKKEEFPDWLEAELDDAAKKNIEKELAGLKDEGLKKELKSLFEKNARFLSHQGKE